MSSTEEIFAAMGEAVKGESGKKLQRKFKGTVVFTITDTDEKWSLDLKSTSPDGSCSVERGDDNMPDPDMRVTVSEETLMKLANKKLNSQQAFMKGLLKIKGKMALAMKFTAVLEATRKFLPKSKL